MRTLSTAELSLTILNLSLRLNSQVHAQVLLKQTSPVFFSDSTPYLILFVVSFCQFVTMRSHNVVLPGPMCSSISVATWFRSVFSIQKVSDGDSDKRVAPIVLPRYISRILCFVVRFDLRNILLLRTLYAYMRIAFKISNIM